MRALHLASLIAVTVAGQGQQPVFQARVDLISLDVSVRRNNAPVRNLTGADFAIVDNGVPQTVRALTPAVLPLDVTFVIDRSRSVEAQEELVRRELGEAVSALKEGDRVRVLTFGTEVLLATPFVSFQSFQPPSTFPASTFSAVHEGLVLALAHDVPVDRRHLVVAFTDAVDTIGDVPMDTLLAVLRRTPAVLHLILPATDMLAATWDRLSTPNGPGFPPLLRTQPKGGSQQLLIDGATRTGGLALTTNGRFGRRSLAGPFHQIIEEYRSSYLLQYELSGVARNGLHDVTISITKPGPYEIRGKKSYQFASDSAVH